MEDPNERVIQAHVTISDKLQTQTTHIIYQPHAITATFN